VETSVADPVAWLHFNGTERSAENAIRAGLADCGVTLCPLANSTVGNGIVCLTEVSAELLQFLREIRHRVHGLVIALSVSTSKLQMGDTWRLLHAGAADTLAWDSHGEVSGHIRARLERWNAIDELAEHVTVEERLIGKSPAWWALVRRVVEAGRFTSTPVLFIGESGTGKELLARLIHLVNWRFNSASTAGREPVTVDCSTIVAELSGSELFGHERGAFTGAVSQREGALALASGGTLFLDEVGELPLALQAQLLRAVQEKTYKRVGGDVWRTTDFRLVCATNRDLAQLVERGQFRLDLYHRIAGWVFRIPSLRERREDILPLAHHFMNAANVPEAPKEFDTEVRDYLLNRSYQGNIRELRQLIQRITHRHVGPGPVTAGDIPEEDRPADGEFHRAWPDKLLEKAIEDAIALGLCLKDISQATIETAIRIAVQSEKGSLQRAARRLGVSDRALQMRRASGKMHT
jgi:transcriptional regulator with GAF, ATPase, and Fis domain